MTIIETIKAEVERLKKQLVRGACAAQIQMETSYKDEAYNEVLSVLDTLKVQPVCDGLEEEIERYLHSLGVGYGGWVDGMEDDDLRGIARHFAKWQREYMMNGAYDGHIFRCGFHNAVKTSDTRWTEKIDGFKVGDKVKLIIIKED